MRALRPGDVIGEKYRVDRVLRADQDELVAVATDSRLEREVVLRVVPPGAGADDVAPAARIAARLRGDAVPRVLDASALSDGSAYVAEEISTGIDLASWLPQRGRLPAAEAVDLILQVCVGLAEAHAHGLVHGDLSPSHLVLSERVDGTRVVRIAGRWRLADRPTAPPVALGHAAPEVLAGAMPNVLSDVWSVGTVLYELLAGTPAVTAQGKAITPVAGLVWDLPEGLAEIVDRCLEVLPMARHPGVAQLAQALAPLGTAQAPSLALAALRLATPPPPPAGLRKIGGTAPPPDPHAAPARVTVALQAEVPQVDPMRRTMSHSAPPAPAHEPRRAPTSAPPPVPAAALARTAPMPAAAEPALARTAPMAAASPPAADTEVTQPRARSTGPHAVAELVNPAPRARTSAPPPIPVAARRSAEIQAQVPPVEVPPLGTQPDLPVMPVTPGATRDGSALPAMSALPAAEKAIGTDTLHGAAPAPAPPPASPSLEPRRSAAASIPPLNTLRPLTPVPEEPRAPSAPPVVERKPFGASIAPVKPARKSTAEQLYAESLVNDTTRLTRAQRKQLLKQDPRALAMPAKHDWLAYPVIGLLAIILVVAALAVHRSSKATAPEVASTAPAVPAAKAEPQVVKPEPQAAKPEPPALQPEPARPEPEAVKPEPQAVKPEPEVKAAPAVKPEPEAVKPAAEVKKPAPVKVAKPKPERHHHRKPSVKPTKPVKPAKPAGDDDPFATPE